MIPVLYKANETDFSHLGLGVLTDTLRAEVTEERNGVFELEVDYPVDGLLFNALKNDRLIRVDASPKLKDQRFRIVHMEKKTNQIMTVFAEHVSYLSQDLALNPTVNYSGNAQSALNTWASNIVDSHPFTTFSDISHSASGRWEIEDVENARRALGGVRGSLLDSYGGEYRFDNYHIQLWQDRGRDSGVLIAYGKNLVDLEQEEEITSTYTSVYPYSIIQDEDGNDAIRITLPELFVDSEHVDKYARRKILVVDFSQDEVKTVEALRNRAEQYIESNNIGVPKVNIRVQFQDLAKTVDYADLKLVEEINLCDTVDVYYEKLDIQTNAKIIKVVWNVLLDEYTELEIGEARSSLSQTVNNIVDGKVDEVDRRVNRVQIAANGKNRIFRGADEPTQGMSLNDLWYKPVGEGETELYRWNGVIWELVVTTGVNNEVNQRLEEAKDIAETARDNTHLLQLDADSILAGLGLDGLGETNQTIVNQIKANVGDRLDDLVDTKVSEDSIQYQSLIERYDLYERVIGSTENDVESNVTRIIQSSNIIQTEVRQSIGDFPNLMPNDTARDMAAGEWQYRKTSDILKAHTPYRVVVSSIEEYLVDLEIDGYQDLTFIYSEGGRNFFETVIDLKSAHDEIELINHDSLPLRSIKIESVKEINPNSLVGQITNVSTQVTQLADSWALNLKENDDIVAAINATSSGVYIKGKNIILDGDTIVDGTFTVTDTIFADNMSISKFTVGTLNAANVNLINVNVNSLVGNTASFIQANFNSASGNSLALDANGIISTSNLYSYRLGSLGVEYIASGIETGIIRSYFDSTNTYSGRTRGIVAMARRGHEFHIGYDSTSAGGNYLPAIAVDGTTGRIYMDNIYPLRSMTHGLEFKSGSVGSQQGWFLQHTNSNRAGMFMANNGHVFVRRANGSYWNLSTWEYA